MKIKFKLTTIALSVLMIFSTTAKAEWFTLYEAKCNLTSGVLEYSTTDDRADSVTVTYGLFKRQFDTDSKIYTNKFDDQATEFPFWRFQDYTSRFLTIFDFDYKKITKKTKLNKVKTSLYRDIPSTFPIWYQLGKVSKVSSGECTIVVGPFEY